MMENKREKQFKQWLETHKGLIFRVIRTYAVTAKDQDDLFQEILLQLWSSIDNFQGKAKETTWIYRIALNTTLIWQRKETRKRKKHSALVLEFKETSCIQNDTDLPYDSQVLEQLYQAIRQLPVMDSCVIVMHLDGVSYDEMAEVLGISKNHVGVRLNRAKARLAKLMKGTVNEF
jgi:RNA polymerase sigma-70 factor (ECF subfamily)